VTKSAFRFHFPFFFQGLLVGSETARDPHEAVVYRFEKLISNMQKTRKAFIRGCTGIQLFEKKKKKKKNPRQFR
jgi:hypothetical protein